MSRYVVTQEETDALAVRLAGGERVSDEMLAELAHANVLTLGVLAEAARRRGSPHVGYARVQTIDGERLADAALFAPATEVRLVGRPASLDEAIAWVRGARELAGSTRRLSAFSLADLQSSADGGWGSLEDVARALSAAGAEDVASVPIDQLEDPIRSLTAARSGGLSARRLTVERHGAGDRSRLVSQVRALHESASDIASFAPLPASAAAEAPTTGYDDLRIVALAAIAFGHLAGSERAVGISVDWQTYGPKLAQVALVFGATHIDRVSAAPDDPADGVRRGVVKDVERNIRAAGYEPLEVGAAR